MHLLNSLFPGGRGVLVKVLKDLLKSQGPTIVHHAVLQRKMVKTYFAAKPQLEQESRHCPWLIPQLSDSKRVSVKPQAASTKASAAAFQLVALDALIVLSPVPG